MSYKGKVVKMPKGFLKIAFFNHLNLMKQKLCYIKFKSKFYKNIFSVIYVEHFLVPFFKSVGENLMVLGVNI